MKNIEVGIVKGSSEKEWISSVKAFLERSLVVEVIQCSMQVVPDLRLGQEYVALIVYKKRRERRKPWEDLASARTARRNGENGASSSPSGEVRT